MKFLSAIFTLFFCTTSALASETAPAPMPAGESAQGAADTAVLARTQEMLSVMQTRMDDVQAAIKGGLLDSYFDFVALTDAPIVAHKKTLSAPQIARLKKIFAQLVRQLAYASGAQFKEGNIKLAKTTKRDAEGRIFTDVTISHPDEDIDSEVTFVWVASAKGARIVDVNLDGASIVKDYENQFAKIIARDGAEGLIKKMQARLKEAEHKVRAKGSKQQ